MDWPAIAVLACGYAAIALLISWVLVPWLDRQLDTGPFDGLLHVIVRIWTRLVHRPQWVGWDKVPPDLLGRGGRGAIVVANHASGADPFLLQVPFHRRIRWLMARDQMVPTLHDLWEHLCVLPVEYGPQDASTFREASRHVHNGGVLGIFPEGGIARPARQVRPFLTGVGLLVARSRAPVILCLLEGLPEAPNAVAGLFIPCRCTVRCLEVIDFGKERDATVIVHRLRQAILDASGWPANDEPLAGSTSSETR